MYCIWKLEVTVWLSFNTLSLTNKNHILAPPLFLVSYRVAARAKSVPCTVPYTLLGNDCHNQNELQRKMPESTASLWLMYSG